MGRSYQHDIKINLKRFSIGVLFGISLFTGCSFNTKEVEGKYLEGEESQKIKVNKSGEVYLVEYNLTNRNMNPARCLQYKNVKKREAEEADKVNFEDDNFIKMFNGRINVDKMNQDFSKNIKIIPQNAREENKPAKVRKLDYQVGDTKEFFLYDKSKNNVFGTKSKYTLTCKYSGKNCVVWFLPSNGYEITDQDCQNLGTKFDKIYDIETNLVGSNIYTVKGIKTYATDPKDLYDVIDSQDKIEIIFSDILFNWDEEKESDYYGFFYQADMFPEECIKQVNDCHSNEGQIIYMDSYIYKKSPDDIYSTLCHEFNHLLNFCQKQQYGMLCDTWYTEMMSMLMEDALQSFLGIEDMYSPKYRLLSYIDKGYTYSPLIWAFELSDPKVLNNYAATYAMGAFFVRNFGGIELLHQIATNNYVDFTSVEEALKTTGNNFEEKYKQYNNFFSAYENMPEILINIEESNQEKYYTLNRTCVDSKYPDVSFNKINIQDSYNYTYEGQNHTIDFNPTYYDNSSSIDILYPYGYKVYYIGKNIKSFKIELPDDYRLNYKIIVK